MEKGNITKTRRMRSHSRRDKRQSESRKIEYIYQRLSLARRTDIISHLGSTFGRMCAVYKHIESALLTSFRRKLYIIIYKASKEYLLIYTYGMQWNGERTKET